MDPITLAIVTALAAGVATGTTEVGKNVIIDAYDALKAVLKNKYGENNDLIDAVNKLEEKPDSVARKDLLREEIKTAKADQNSEVLEAAQTLLDQLKAQPGGEQHIQTAIGNYIAQADRGGTASVEVNERKG